MKLPWFKRLYEKDFDEEYQQLVSDLAGTINTSFENIYLALSNRLSFSDNFGSSIIDVIIEVDDFGRVKNGNTFKINKLADNSTSKVLGLQVIKAVNISNNGKYPEGTPFITFRQSEDIITIDNITSLPINTSFKITVLTIS